MATRTRWGILATGGIAATFVADLKLLPQAEVVAVGSRTPAAARRFADAHDIPRAYGSWTGLVEDPEVDVIYVATPHSAHHEAAALCLRAGKPVLCEKPFALNLAQSEDLVRIAAATGTFLMEAMWMRTIPAVRRAVEVIRDGAIGKVSAVYADFGLAGPFPPDHRLRDPRLGGGALLDLGVYPVSLAQFVLGAPERVAAVAALTPEGVDENTAIALGYADGAIASLHAGIAGRTPTVATVVGTGGRVELPALFFRPERFRLIRGEEVEVHEAPLRGNGMGYEAEEVMRCLAEGRTESELVPLTETLAVMRTLDEIRALVGVRYPGVDPRP